MINDNFKLISYSYGVIAEIQRIAYHIRSLVLINTGVFNSYSSYTTSTDFVEWAKQDIDEALDNLYLLQNNISLSTISLIDPHFKLIYNKTVPLYF